MLYSLPLDELSNFSGQPVAVLKDYPYSKLEEMTDNMKKKKAEDESVRNAKDQEFARLVRKYFTPYEFLKTWWNDEEIILACSRHLSEGDLVQEKAVLKSDAGVIRAYDNPKYGAEFLRESVEYVPAYDKFGRQYMDSERAKCRVYRIKNQYQGTRHGSVILDLLYTRFPSLRQFDFSAYSFSDSQYQIYPKNHIYTPFVALMNGDIETIKKRTMDYAKSFNHGFCTLENMKKILESEEGKHFFKVIQNLER